LHIDHEMTRKSVRLPYVSFTKLNEQIKWYSLIGRAHWNFTDQGNFIYIRAYNIACEHETNIILLVIIIIILLFILLFA
jgi:hypothetical protein